MPLSCSLSLPGVHVWRLTFVVGSNEAQDVLVPQHDSLVDLCLSEPGALLSRGENLHRNLLATPFPPPNFAKAALPDALLEDDGSGDGSLDQQRQACADSRRWFSRGRRGSSELKDASANQHVLQLSSTLSSLVSHETETLLSTNHEPHQQNHCRKASGWQSRSQVPAMSILNVNVWSPLSPFASPDRTRFFQKWAFFI